MSVTISGGGSIPANVVEIGNEVTQGIVDALNGASAPTSSNVFATASNIPAIATIAQSEALLSETVVVSPLDLRYAMFNPSFYRPTFTAFSGSSFGTSGLNDTLHEMRRLQGPTGGTNTYVRIEIANRMSRGRSYSNNIDWTKPVAFAFRIIQAQISPDTNSIFRGLLGEGGSTNTGDPTVRSIGIKFNGLGNFVLLAHDGTTLTSVTTSIGMTVNISQDILITSDGNGTINLYSNNSLIATTNLGPKTLVAGFGNFNNINFRIENPAPVGLAQNSIYIGGVVVHCGN